MKTNQKQCYQPRVENRIYLSVPFDDKDAAKLLGAWWDPMAKSWYITNAKLAKFPQFCIWMYPGEQKTLAKKMVEWLQINDPSELVNIEYLVLELKEANKKSGEDAAAKALHQAMAK